MTQHAWRPGLAARISDSTVWRWLHEDAIRPWQHRCWIFARIDVSRPRPLASGTCTNAAGMGSRGARTSSSSRPTKRPASRRAHPSQPLTRPGEPMRVEQEAAPRRCLGVPGRVERASRQDVRPMRSDHRHHAFRTTGRSGHESAAVRHRAPCVLGQGQRSSHRGEACVRRLPQAHPRMVPVHGSVHGELAQPGRDLLLERAAQGADPERLPLPGGDRSGAGELRALLRAHRAPIRVEVHACQSQCTEHAYARSERRDWHARTGRLAS